MEISCFECAMQHSDACDDCVVSHVLDQQSGAVVFDMPTERALRLLAKAGMIPESRFRSA